MTLFVLWEREREREREREIEREREREISVSNTQDDIDILYLCFYSVVQKVFSFLQHAVNY